MTSIAILADDAPSWHPSRFDYGMWGSRMGLDYLKVKLLDYRDNWAYLTDSDNPFAIVVMAHLKALETRHDHSLRKRWKTQLTRLLYKRGYSRIEVINLYLFIDWVMALPEALELDFLEDMLSYEKEEKMPYISSAERIGRRKGFKEGHKEGHKESLLSFVRQANQQGVAVSTIAEIVDLDIDTVNQILRNETVDVPLHLLDADHR